MHHKTKSLTCKFAHQSPIKLLAHLPIFYKSLSTPSPEGPSVDYGLSGQLEKKTVPSVSSQTQREGGKLFKTPLRILCHAQEMLGQSKQSSNQIFKGISLSQRLCTSKHPYSFSTLETKALSKTLYPVVIPLFPLPPNQKVKEP